MLEITGIDNYSTALTGPALPPPCPHGYTFIGNCSRCKPPPAYSPMNGQKTR